VADAAYKTHLVRADKVRTLCPVYALSAFPPYCCCCVHSPKRSVCCSSQYASQTGLAASRRSRRFSTSGELSAEHAELDPHRRVVDPVRACVGLGAFCGHDAVM